MKKSFRSWINPYVDLINSKPNYILPFMSDSAPSTFDQGLLTEARSIVDSRRLTAARCYVEIGSGSGHHLIQLAARDHDALFVGFELRYKRAFRTAEKAENLMLSNLLVLRTDAKGISSLFPPDSISGIFVNFPDPWSKKRRWMKHRLLSPTYFDELHRVLAPNGFISYKTDHKEYFEDTVDVINNSGLFCIKFVTRNLHSELRPPDNILTEFENLFISKGLPICLLRAEKILKPS